MRIRSVKHWMGQVFLPILAFLLSLMVMSLGATATSVHELSEALASSDWSVRLDAAESLRAMGRQAAEAVPALARALEDPSDYVGKQLVNKAIVGALGAIGTEAAEGIGALASLIQCEDASTREAAAAALGKIGVANDAAVGALALALRDDSAVVRRAAASALGEMELDPLHMTGVAALIDASNDPALAVRMVVTTSLKKVWLNGRSMDAALADALSDPSAVMREAAVRALAKSGSKAVAALTQALADQEGIVRLEAIRSLGSVGKGAESAVSSLAALLEDSDPAIRSAVVESISAIGGDDAFGALRPMVHDPDIAVRLAAISALGKADAEEAPAALAEMLEDDSPEVHVAALKALAQYGSRASEQGGVVAGLLSSHDDQVADGAVQALVAMGDPVIPALREVLSSTDTRARIRGVRVLMSTQHSSRAASELLFDNIELLGQIEDELYPIVASIDQYVNERIEALWPGMSDYTQAMQQDPSSAGLESGTLRTLGWGPVIETGLELYVATDGDDSNDGTIDHPFKTLEKARDTIRGLSDLPEQGVTVWIRGGDYFRTSSFDLTAQDSGHEGRPIIYRAYPNEQVRLFGGKAVDPSDWQPINSQARARVHPNVDPGKLVELDVAALGFANIKSFPSRFTTQWGIIDLFADGQRQPISQWPNPDENIRGVNDSGWTTCNGSKDVRSFFYGDGGTPQDGDRTNEVEMDGTSRIDRWIASMAQGHGIWLKGFWRVPWTPETSKVAEINKTEGWIRLEVTPNGGMGSKYTAEVSSDPAWRVGGGNEKWKALNLLDEIDLPGEWALDFKDKKVYYYPPAPVEELYVTISDLADPIIRIRGAANLQVIGIVIEGGLGAGVELTNSRDVIVAGCTIRNIGGTGILDIGGSRNGYQSNDIYQVGSYSICLQNAGDRRTLRDSGTYIVNNHIHHTNRLISNPTIYMSEVVGVYVAHNLIHDIPAGGINSRNLNNSIFEYNETHNNALTESDMGAYYNYGGWTTYGNVYRYNFIHHINRSNGFYSDDGDSGDTYYKNIVQGSITALKFGGGHDLYGLNNLLVNNRDSEIDSRGISRGYTVDSGYGRNVMLMGPDREPWKSYGETLGRVFGYTTNLWDDVRDVDWHPEYPNGSKIMDCVVVGSGSIKGPDRGFVEISRNVTIPRVSDAGFYDYSKMDLRTDSTVILSKFPNLNEVFPMIGLRLDEYRTRVVTREEVGGLGDRGQSGDLRNEDQFVD